MMDQTLITALSEVTNNGLWAVFWYSLFKALPDLIFVIAMIVGVRASWKKLMEHIERENEA